MQNRNPGDRNLSKENLIRQKWTVCTFNKKNTLDPGM